MSANLGGVGCGPSDIDAQVATDGPAQQRHSCRNTAMRV
jgi:hypothetical protein